MNAAARLLSLKAQAYRLEAELDRITRTGGIVLRNDPAFVQLCAVQRQIKLETRRALKARG